MGAGGSDNEQRTVVIFLVIALHLLVRAEEELKRRHLTMDMSTALKQERRTSEPSLSADDKTSTRQGLEAAAWRQGRGGERSG